MEKVLIIDDSNFNRVLLKKILKANDIDCIEASDGLEGLEILRTHYKEINAITVDRQMPKMNGMEFVETIKKIDKLKEIPVIFITTISEKEKIKEGLLLGVYDYLIKPVEPDLTFLKIRNALEFYKNKKIVDQMNEELEIKVREKTKELREMTNSLLNALEKANYYNDENTGKHIQRVSAYSKLIAEKIGLPQDLIIAIETYSPLHDIGKVGIPDSILKKNGKLTKEEFEEMKQHVVIGYNLIKNSPLSDIAKNIIRYHHEQWTGGGYMEGLKGEEIPIEARIVALADVFDALTSKRPYKDEYSLDKTINIIREKKGIHFDPDLVDVFLKNLSKVIDIKEKLKDEEE